MRLARAEGPGGGRDGGIDNANLPRNPGVDRTPTAHHSGQVKSSAAAPPGHPQRKQAAQSLPCPPTRPPSPSSCPTPLRVPPSAGALIPSAHHLRLRPAAMLPPPPAPSAWADSVLTARPAACLLLCSSAHVLLHPLVRRHTEPRRLGCPSSIAIHLRPPPRRRNPPPPEKSPSARRSPSSTASLAAGTVLRATSPHGGPVARTEVE